MPIRFRLPSPVLSIVVSGLVLTAATGCGTSSGGSSTSTGKSGLASGGASSIYVVQTASGGGSILQFPVTATGTAVPSATLTTPAGTTIQAVATDSSGQIYVGVFTSTAVGEVLVYAAGSTGAATPSRTIVGASPLTANAATFTIPQSMVVGANNVLYILSATSSSGANPYAVTAFSSTANGSATPLSYITGSQSQLYGPLSIAADAAGNVYVSTFTSASTGAILVFASGATGNVAPVRVITSANPFYGVAVDAAANIYSVEDSLTATVAGSIVEFSAGASGAATPVRTIAGAATGFFFGGGIRVDAAGNLYVVNVVSPTTSGIQTVVAYPPAANGNVAATVNFTSTAWNPGGSEIAIK